MKSAAMAGAKTQRFELRDAHHDKFWEIHVSGASVVVRFGRRGSDGVEKVARHRTPAEAERVAAKLIEQKTKKGYRRVLSGAAPARATSAAGVKGRLQRLSTLWAEKRPGFEKRLRPGATPARLAAFQKALGLKMPREFLAFYAWHDGAKDHQIDRLEVFGWLSLRGLLDFKKMLDTMGFDDESTYPKYSWSPTWVPFLEADGDSVCVDSRSGIVFERLNDTSVVLLAPSFAAWLDAHVAITEAVPATSDGDPDDVFFEAFNGDIGNRVRRKVSPGYPKRVPNAKSLF